MWTYRWPKLVTSAQYWESTSRTFTLSMKVWRPLLLHLALRLLGLVRADVVVGQRVVDDLQAHLDGHLVRRRAVLPEQVLQDEDGHVRADLHLADQILADDLAGEEAVDLVVEGVARWGREEDHPQIPRFTGISSDWAIRASVVGSCSTIWTNGTS